MNIRQALLAGPADCGQDWDELFSAGAGFITGFVRGTSLSNLIAYVLLLGVAGLVVWRLRWRLVTSPRLTDQACPSCGRRVAPDTAALSRSAGRPVCSGPPLPVQESRLPLAWIAGSTGRGMNSSAAGLGGGSECFRAGPELDTVTILSAPGRCTSPFWQSAWQTRRSTGPPSATIPGRRSLIPPMRRSTISRGVLYWREIGNYVRAIQDLTRTLELEPARDQSLL